MLLWSNNASTTLAGSITATDTTITVASGTGVEFPSPTGGDYFKITFYDQATKTLDEICHCTSRSGDTFTIVRAQEGTTALAWNAGDIVSNLITAGTLRAFVQAGTGPVNTSQVYVGTDVGTVNHVVATTNPTFTTYSTGMLFCIKIANTNSDIVDVQLNGLPAIALRRTNGADMKGGDITASEEIVFIHNGTDFTSWVPDINKQPPVFTFYVRTDGNDNNDGIANTPQHAFRSISGGMKKISNNYQSANTITMIVADGTYSECVYAVPSPIASWYLYGNPTNPGNCVIDATSIAVGSYPPAAQAGSSTIARGMVSQAGTVIWANGFTFKSYFENAATSGAGVLTIANCHFTAPTSGRCSPIAAYTGGFLVLYGNCRYDTTANSQTIMGASGTGKIELGYYDGIASQPLNFDIEGTPANITTATMIATSGGYIVFFNQVVTWSGITPACKKYVAQSGGGISSSTGVYTVIPGALAGTVTAPGWTS